jgi:hypothetical protein
MLACGAVVLLVLKYRSHTATPDARPVAPPAVGPKPPVQRRPPLQRPQSQYIHIAKPIFKQVLSAALIWDEIAESEGLEYAFVGSFAARFNANRNEEFQIYEIEILVEPAVLANYCETLTEIMRRNPNRMTITASDRGANRHIIVIDEDGAPQGIALQFFATDTLEFPDPLVAPRESQFHAPESIQLKPTYRYQLVNNYRPLPILRFHFLLYQRLTRFDVNSTDRDICARNCRDIDDIKVFLRCTFMKTEYDDCPFPPAVANSLLNTVRAWVRFADNCDYKTTEKELQMWRNLHIVLTRADLGVQRYLYAAVNSSAPEDGGRE